VEAGREPATGSLRLGEERGDVLTHAARRIGEAWRSFDAFRPTQPLLSPAIEKLLGEPLPESPSPALQTIDEAVQILDESIAQSRPRYFAYVGSSGLEIGVVADALAAAHDINLATDSLAATAIEREAVRWVAQFVGFPATGGTFTSGGTISNMTAIAAARERALPGSRRTGLAGARPVVYASREVHYSVRRAAETLGIGSDHVRVIDLDERRRLRPALLAAAIDADLAAGNVPVCVIATAGTTLTGAIDPLDAIADVCDERGVWLHVDGAYGLPAAGTPEAAPLFAGLERARSASMDAHKWLFLPKACGVVLVRDEADLSRAFSHADTYMPHAEERPNAVETTLEYSRPFRALKLWLAFRTHGAAAFRSAIGEDIRLARHLAARVRASPELDLLEDPQLSIVCFRHVPPGIGDVDAHNAELVRAIQRDARCYVSPGDVDGVTYLRPCIVNYRSTEADVDALVDVALELGRKLADDRR
jgi:aromatic-L-amino-acid/L-tryptophan decarboxylase